MDKDTSLTSDIDFSSITTKSGNSLEELSKKNPILLVFLRHLGCVFCKEALQDLSKKKQYLEDRGVKLVFVHMGPEDEAQKFFAKYDLGDYETVCDPDCKYYAEFSLVKGTFSQLFGLQVMLRGFEASVVKGNSLSLRQIGDGFQMPGIFLISNGQIREQYIHKLASDVPNYDNLISCCTV